jgi:uncharacterized RDD family membrane protein YckC
VGEIGLDEESQQPLASQGTEHAVLDTKGWVTSPPAPWRRYGARMLDTIANGYSGAIVLGYVWGSFAPYSAERFFALFDTPLGRIGDIIFTYVIAGLVGGFVIGLTGTSLGKAIFGIRVVNPSLQTIGVGNGIKREFVVWGQGMGLGIPIVSLITMLVAYASLRRDGAARWDLGHNVVLYRPRGTFQTVLNVLGVVLILLAFRIVRDIEKLL